MAQKEPNGTHLALDEFTKTSLTKSIFQAGLFLQGASEIFEIGDDGGVEGGDFHPIWNVHLIAREAAKPLTVLEHHPLQARRFVQISAYSFTRRPTAASRDSSVMVCIIPKGT